MSKSIWKHPNPEATTLNAFRVLVNRKFSLNLVTYQDIYNWSVTDVTAFASAVWEFAGMKYSVPPTHVVDGLEQMFPPPKWFPGARLNFAENILTTGLATRPDGIAVTAFREGFKDLEELTFKQLEGRVAAWANALRKIGVVARDRIASESLQYSVPLNSANSRTHVLLRL
jgi:acetoacetyl-CoA synthetase